MRCAANSQHLDADTRVSRGSLVTTVCEACSGDQAVLDALFARIQREALDKLAWLRR